MDPRIERCDLCIVGAGLAGMNALFVASRYLGRDQRVILIDRRERSGGMWVDTYPYVRLHQPHPMFTAGNITWTLNRRPEHLACKSEVLDHFEHCLSVIDKDLRVDKFFGWTMEATTESAGTVRVHCRTTDGRQMTVEAERLIKAYGFRVDPNEPLRLSSQKVHSVSPDTCDMRGAPIAEDGAPIWIIGGGKTAMDTGPWHRTDRPRRRHLPRPSPGDGARRRGGDR